MLCGVWIRETLGFLFKYRIECTNFPEGAMYPVSCSDLLLKYRKALPNS